MRTRARPPIRILAGLLCQVLVALPPFVASTASAETAAPRPGSGGTPGPPSIDDIARQLVASGESVGVVVGGVKAAGFNFDPSIFRE